MAKVFNKVHAKVMRDIENLDCSQDFTVANFGKRTFKTEKGNEYPMYEMTKDGFTFLVMGYTGKKAAEFKEAYIAAFNKMEAELRSQQPKQLSESELLFKSSQLSAQYLIAHERQIGMLEHDTQNMKGAIKDLFDKVYSLVFELDLLKEKTRNEIDRYTVIEYCSLNHITMTRKEASVIGGACSRECKRQGISVETIPDPRFGKVNTYPSEMIAKAIAERRKAIETTLSV